MSNAQLKILVAIDHNLFANGLSRLLSDIHGVTVCKVVSCGNQLVEEYGVEQPDVAIVDLNMPNLNGIQATRKIMKDFPNAKIIILSLYINTSLIKQLKNLGIKGYLESNCDFESLVETIKKVNEGSQMYDQKELSQSEEHSGEFHLTAREIEILKWLAEGYTNSEIARELFISAQTVDTHRKRLIDKLGVRNSVELVSKALRHGLIIWSAYYIALEAYSTIFI
jgi:DNA-binding NarL/FixJ family response regulator